MPERNHLLQRLRVTSVIASLTAGGIGPVCRYAAEGMAKLTDWQVTLLSLHDPVDEFTQETSGLRIVCLGLNGDCARQFLQWLADDPQDLVITSDVCHIEPAFRFLPARTLHIVQIHDSGKRYREGAVRHSACIDGVTCVGKHIEAPLKRSLAEVAYRGLLRTVHNGASFPPTKPRESHGGPLRLLFMGRVEPLKGVFDLVPLLQQLQRWGVTSTLNLVGGENAELRKKFQRKGLEGSVTWSGLVPHARCYDIAAESDLLLMPTRKESFGMVTIEAMSMGCVPIAYDIPSGSVEIIEPDKNGLLVPLGDIRAWAEEIRNIHYDRKRLAKLSVAAVARARSAFSADTMARNMIAFLSAVIVSARIFPAVRESGMPSAGDKKLNRGYHRLPSGLPEWIRNQVHAHPKISHWLLSR